MTTDLNGGGGLEATDDDLLRAVRGRDEQALAALYDRHAGWLTVRLTRRCGSPDIVDETVQDTFMAVWRCAGTYRGTGEVGAFIWGIASRRLVDAIRRDRTSRRATNSREFSPPDQTVDSAEDLVLLSIEHGRLGEALAQLAPELRAAFQATVLDQLTYAEAARLLGVPEGTVKSRCSRARTHLREVLTG